MTKIHSNPLFFSVLFLTSVFSTSVITSNDNLNINSNNAYAMPELVMTCDPELADVCFFEVALPQEQEESLPPEGIQWPTEEPTSGEPDPNELPNDNSEDTNNWFEGQATCAVEWCTPFEDYSAEDPNPGISIDFPDDNAPIVDPEFKDIFSYMEETTGPSVEPEDQQEEPTTDSTEATTSIEESDKIESGETQIEEQAVVVEADFEGPIVDPEEPKENSIIKSIAPKEIKKQEESKEKKTTVYYGLPKAPNTGRP